MNQVQGLILAGFTPQVRYSLFACMRSSGHGDHEQYLAENGDHDLIAAYIYAGKGMIIGTLKEVLERETTKRLEELGADDNVLELRP